jgi:dTDP-4-amino-4,6-dideoxygalactose transaminase
MSSNSSERLAIHGGQKAVRSPIPPRKRHGEREKALLAEVIESDILFFFLGTKVRQFEREMAELYGRRFAIACSSGTAAVHMAIAALQLPPGREVIVPAITDMGSVTGILFQGLVPVFADVNPDTLNMDPTSVRNLVNERTGAILVVHHAGLPADLDALLDVARQAGLAVVEDCAQAWGARYRGRPVGTFAKISAFSLNHFKHITCGSGGAVLMDDEPLRYFCSLFLDKCYQREERIRNPFFLAPNYQMTELQAAVALAQLERLGEFVERRNRLGRRLDAHLQQIPGVRPQLTPENAYHSYFLYLFRLDRQLLDCSAEEFAEAVQAEGVPAKARLITGGRPVYLYDIFQQRSAFPGSTYPFRSQDTGADRVYRRGDCPVAEAAFDDWLTIEFTENLSETNIDEFAQGIAKVAAHFRQHAAVPGSLNRNPGASHA